MSGADSHAGATILLVEDDVDVRGALRLVLESEGFAVREAVDGLDAMSLLDEGLRPVLIVLDLMMPRMNGWEFLKGRRRHAWLAAIPVIVLTAKQRNMADSDGLPVDVEIMSKPPNMPALVKLIRRLGKV